MTENPTRMGFIPINDLVNPISGENPCGISLRYEPIYDQIREARREDDDSVSYGIWQRELKRADWFRVENLCCDVLQHQTKDLQIAGWLAEAWIQLDDINGLSRGIELISKLSDSFWDHIHPTIKAGDLEYRSQFFDWLNKNLSDRLVKLQFVPNELGEGISYADWLAAQRLDTVKRTPNSERWVKKAEERGQISYKQCQTLLSRVTTHYGDSYLESLYTAQSQLNDLKTVLDNHFSDNTLAFDELTNYLDEMIRIYKSEMSSRERSQTMVSDDSLTLNLPPQPPLPPDSDTNTDQSNLQTIPQTGQLDRDQAYQQLEQIAALLEKIEPHSPAPQIIRKVIAWKNKSLMEIFNDLGSSPDDLVALMRFLGIGGSRPAA